jgi:hypothetical protein
LNTLVLADIKDVGFIAGDDVLSLRSYSNGKELIVVGIVVNHDPHWFAYAWG